MARQRNGAWQADITVQGRRYREQGFASKADAEAWEATARANVLNGKPVPPAPSAAGGGGSPRPHLSLAGGATLRELRDLCLSDPEIWKGTKNEKDVTRLSSAACDRFGWDTPAASVTPAEVTRWRLEMVKAGKKNQTINNYLNALSRMLRAGEDGGLLDRRPKVQRMSPPKAREWYIEPAKVPGMIAQIRAGDEAAGLEPDPEIADLVLFLLEQGCRVGEALSLEWGHAADGMVRFFDTKNGDDRFMPQTEAVKAMLARRRHGTAEADDRVFPLSYVSYARRFAPWRDKLGVPKGTNLHLLRHTCATALASSGSDLGAVGAWLGHRDVRTTRKYAKYTPGALAGVAAAVANAYGKGAK